MDSVLNCKVVYQVIYSFLTVNDIGHLMRTSKTIQKVITELINKDVRIKRYKYGYVCSCNMCDFIVKDPTRLNAYYKDTGEIDLVCRFHFVTLIKKKYN